MSRRVRFASFHAVRVGLFVATVLLGGVALVAGTTRQGDQPKPEKKDPPRRVEEEEDDGKPIKRKVIDVDEGDVKQAPGRAPTDDLAKLARETRHKYARNLFTRLAIPFDEVTLIASVRVTVSGERTLGGTIRVEPLAEYVSDVRDLKGPVLLHFQSPEGKRIKSDKVSVGSIRALRYYEQIAMDEVRGFIEERFSQFASDHPDYLSRHDQLLAGEAALSAVARFHQSARERGVRQGDSWDKLASELRTMLLDVLLKQLDELAAAKSWDQAFALTRRMTETYTRESDHKQIADPLANLLKKAFDDPNFAQERLRDARLRLRQFEDRFPGSKVLEPLRQRLQDQAKRLFDRARELDKEKKPAEALDLLKQAEETWPDLPGLRAYRLQVDSTYQILRVTMRELPRFLSPGRAVTDAERRGVDLLFESLVDLAPDETGAMSYHPALAGGRPEVVKLGRQFKLPRNARWSDGGEVTASDIRFTLQRLQEGREGRREGTWRDATTGRPAAWGDLLNAVRVAGDPFRARLVLRQGFLDPLAAMSFKVLPRRSRPDPDSEAFALKPISSGPFRYAGRQSEPPRNREYAAFVANPDYGTRLDRLGLPRIKEVRCFALADPVKGMKEEELDLALDLTAAQAVQLRDAGFVVPLSSDQPNRRIYFLAVNHRKAPLSNVDLRVALARAIDRETLLDEYFRKGLGRQVHRAINGPFPARSWASNPALAGRGDKATLDPHDADLAKTKVKLALAKLGTKELRLTVKYPAGDPAVAGAVAALCDQVGRTLEGVTLTPEERPPHSLREDVEQTASYELAYCWYDFPDEALWLGPLLGQGGRSGENYLGYTGKLVGKIQSAWLQRDFAQVRDQARAIHREFLEGEMPFIPLWQLDALYAHRKGLEMPPVEMYRLFARVAQWRVSGR